MSKNVNRRQFTRSVAAGAAAVATGAIAAKTVQGCPVKFDKDGNRVEYWCRHTYDDSNPMMWLYTWKRCTDGSYSYIWGPPHEPLGSCDFADQDEGCVDYDPVLIDADTIRVAGESVHVLKRVTEEQREYLRTLLLARKRA